MDDDLNPIVFILYVLFSMFVLLFTVGRPMWEGCLLLVTYTICYWGSVWFVQWMQNNG